MRWWFVRGRKRLVTGAAAVVLAAAGTGAWALTRSPTSAASAQTVLTVSQGTVRQTVNATGTINPARRADLSFAVSGTVTSVPAVVGEKVGKGVPLARLDTSSLTSAVTTAQAGVDAADQAVTAAASSTGAEQASAAAQLAAAQSTLARARTALADGTLRAPFAGTVAAVNLAAGDVVGGAGTGGSGSAGGGGQSGQGAQSGGSAPGSTGSAGAEVVLISTTSWVVDAMVAAPDLASVRTGMEAEIVPTGGSGTVFGTVQSVGILATSTSVGQATFPVEIAVTGNPPGLYAGGTASVAIVTRQVPDVLTVPTLALRTSGGRTVVTLVRNGTDVTTPVTVGTAYGPSTQVLAGLSPGDQVVVTLPRAGAERSGNGTGGTTGRRGQLGGGFTGGGFTGGGFTGGGFTGGRGGAGG